MVKKAVIIAAGRGSRLNGNGEDLPKPLVPVAGVGLLKRTILSAKRAGIGEFVIVTGFRGQEIREAIASDPQVDVQIDWVENPEWELGNGRSVLKAREYVNEIGRAHRSASFCGRATNAAPMTNANDARTENRTIGP